MNHAIARAEVEMFRAQLHERFGLHFDDSKLDELSAVLSERLRANGGKNAHFYIETIRRAPNHHPEIRTLVTELTIGETYFFRNPNHFLALCEKVIPDILGKQSFPRRLRILSAGAASGEEAYTVAMLVKDNFERWLEPEVSILGIDLNKTSLDKARSGKYSAWSLRATSDEARSAYFKKDKEFLLDEKVRQLVTFEERNLSADDPAFWLPNAFDVIFCRNVLIYFSRDSARRVIARFAHSLGPGGYLFMGDAETLRELSNDFHLQHTNDTFYYKRREAQSGSAEVMPRSTSPELRRGGTTPVLAEPDSWIDAIQRSSDRIENLGRPARLGSQPNAVDILLPPEAANFALDFKAALTMLGDDRTEEAWDRLQSLPLVAQKDRKIQLLRAVILTNRGEMCQAETTCQQLLALDELHAGAYYLLALCRDYAGELEQAIENDLTAIYLDPNFAMPHFHLGRVAKRRGDVTAARLEFVSALSLLATEDSERILLFGGGFARDGLVRACQNELRGLGVAP